MEYIYECEECGDSHSETHNMNEDPKILCPKCKKLCFRAIQPVTGYVRGNCYLDKPGCKKAMNIATLKDNDPYGGHRQPGEVDDLVTKIKHGDKGKISVGVNGTKKSK